MFDIKFTTPFQKVYKKYFRNNIILTKAIKKTILQLSLDLFHPSLKTHKVDTKRNHDIWSSTITGDWHVGWIFDSDNKTAIIICLEVGTHSGANQIYKNKS